MNIFKKALLKLSPQKLKDIYQFELKLQLSELNRGEALLSYSQQAEDLAIQRYFEDKQNGFFIDIGAFHPIKYSNTYLFYKKGWNGINIEPNPENIELFKVIRPNDLTLNIGISDQPQKLTYYQFNVSALNTFDEMHANQWAKKEGFSIKKTLEIETFPLKEILQKHLKKEQIIDFMTIDVEAYDLKVLKSNDWENYRPTLLLVEEYVYDKNSFQESEICKYMGIIGYKLWCISGGTIIFSDGRIQD